MLLPLLFIFAALSYATDPLCPQNASGWEEFRADVSDPPVQGLGKVYKYAKTDEIFSKFREQERNKFVLGCIEATKNNPKSDPQISKCLVRLENNLNYLLAGAGKNNYATLGKTSGEGYFEQKRKLGYKVTDDEYMENNKQDLGVQVIPERLGSKTFLESIQTKTGFNNEIKKLRAEQANKPDAQKWRILRFQSSAEGLDERKDNQGRLLVVVPGKECDSFYQIVTPSESATEEEWAKTKLSQYSLLKVCHTQNGKTLPKSQVMFQDFWRVGENNNEISTRHALGKPNSNCASCHTNGFLMPNVDESLQKLSDQDEQEFNFIKNYTSKFRPPDFVSRNKAGVLETQLTSDMMGVPVGTFKTPEERSETLDYCIGPLAKENKSKRNKISHYMNCTNCHDGTNRGTLQYSSLGELSGPAREQQLDYIKNPRFHQEFNLDSEGRNLLSKCLLEEFNVGGRNDKFREQERLLQVPCQIPKLNAEEASKEACSQTNILPDDAKKLAQAPIHNTDKSVFFTVDDPFNQDTPNSLLVKNADGSFSREVFTSVCHEGAGQCYPIRFRLEFDQDGNYKDMIPMQALSGDKHTFTKLNHEKFSPEDFNLLKTSIKTQLAKKEAVVTNPKGTIIDGFSGATLLSSETAYPTVPGAAYTTFKVVEYANQTQQEIRNLKKNP